MATSSSAAAAAASEAPARTERRSFAVPSINCVYDGDVKLVGTGEAPPKLLELLLKTVAPDERHEYRYRLQQEVDYLFNPWYTCRHAVISEPVLLCDRDSGLPEWWVAHGKGSLKARENGSILYEGAWAEGYRHGTGDALIFANMQRILSTTRSPLPSSAPAAAASALPPPAGSDEQSYTDRPLFVGRYSGAWRAGMRDGKGILLEVNGERYEGEWKFDKRNGTGVQNYAGGSSFRGYFSENYPHRSGVFVWPSGTMEDREYFHGQLVVSAARPVRPA